VCGDVCAGKSCWIALDEDGRNKQLGIFYRFGLQYSMGASWPAIQLL
jgi:hypothetical protein